MMKLGPRIWGGGTRRRFLGSAMAMAAMPWWGWAGRVAGGMGDSGWVFEPEKPLIPAPSDPSGWGEFRRQLEAWRGRRRAELAYSDALYRRSDFGWVASNFACCFLMLGDEAFYDAGLGRYRVEEFLEAGRREFGGFDSVVLWHAYPRIGLDDRNQFDFYRDAPGGLEGLRGVVRACHRAGVRVYVDYNPWDTATRREGVDDVEALAGLVGALEADGIFLDTLDRGAEGLRARLDGVRRGVALESEIALPLERVADHHMSWAQWFGDSAAPGVLRNKWFERRHIQHQIDRWATDHTGELQQAWMNGSGMLVWENVFGSWVGWCGRDRSILRLMLPIQRRYAGVWAGEGWVPLVPTRRDGVFASEWSGMGVTLWTLVNRTEEEVVGELLEVGMKAGERLFDLMAGREVAVRPGSGSGRGVASGRLMSRGLGCFLRVPAGGVTRSFRRFLEGQRVAAGRVDWGTAFPARAARRVGVERTAERGVAGLAGDLVPVAGCEGELVTEFRARECGFLEATAPEFLGGWKVALHRPHRVRRQVQIRPFAMEVTPVTNGAYAEFLKATGYRPRHGERFLAHWVKGAPPEGREDHPVVYVDLGDARAYARWSGRRLPTDEEWQWAAEGADGRRYPWGNTWEAGRCNDGSTGATSSVRAFPRGATPSGLFDLCGNVWHWTESEHRDGRTRFAVLRGGSYYRRGGSDWYFDEGPQRADFAAKVLLMWPGLDRCANVGFRCVVDVG